MHGSIKVSRSATKLGNRTKRSINKIFCIAQMFALRAA